MRTLNSSLTKGHAAYWSHHLESLSVQSKFLDVVALEQQSNAWSRIMFSLPAGQMSFMNRAGIDCLPTPVNLCRWRLQSDPSCPLCCSRPCTVNHILNCCPTALTQDRYTWRHDSVLAHTVDILRSHLPDGSTLYADLPGHRALDNPPSTVPLSIVPTTARPDIVIIQDKTIKLLELTVPANTVTHITNARMRKQSKQNYIALTNDLEVAVFFAVLDTLEIGSLGHFTKEAITTIQTILPTQTRRSIANLLSELSKVAVACSAHIFQARCSTDWNPNTPLIHPFTSASI